MPKRAVWVSPFRLTRLPSTFPRGKNWSYYSQMRSMKSEFTGTFTKRLLTINILSPFVQIIREHWMHAE